MSNSNSIPSHVGFILDGNRRWAKAHGVPTLEGHRQGYNNLKDITRACIDRGVKYVSAYIFSTENWNRTSEEVKYLMELAYRMLTKDVNELNKEDVRVVWLGSRDKLSDKMIHAIENAETATMKNSRGTLALCFNYGGQEELVDAVRKIIDLGTPSTEITKDILASALYAPEVPPIDFLVRTSGEERLSGFMTYRTTYSELYFTDKYWPDFNEADLDAALLDYSKRNRRVGK